MNWKWLETIGRVLMDDELSGGGDGGAPAAGGDTGGDGGAAPTGADGGGADGGSGGGAAEQTPSLDGIRNRVFGAMYPEPTGGDKDRMEPPRTPDPSGSAPSAPELPPMPTEELLTTDPVRAMEMLEARSNAAAEARFGGRLNELEKRLAAGDNDRRALRDTVGAEFEASASAALARAEETIQHKLLSDDGFFARSPEFRSNPEVQEIVGDMIAGKVEQARAWLTHPNPKARIAGLQSLDRLSSDPKFPRVVLAIARALTEDGPESAAAINYQGGHLTGGSPHSEPPSAGLDPDVEKTAKALGVDPKEILAERKRGGETYL